MSEVEAQFGSEASSGSPRRKLQKFNPATGQLLAEYPIANESEVQTAVVRSRQAWQAWRVVSAPLRSLLLNDVAALVKQQAKPLATLISQETGKPLRESLEADIATAIGILTYYAKHGPKLLKDKQKPLDKGILMGRVHVEKRHPRGVAAVISPWNFPLAIPVSGLATMLMAGNTAILKASELTPGVGEAIVQLFRHALQCRNLPQDAVQSLTGDGSTGQALVNAPIDYAVFTGSHGTGQKVRAALQAQGKAASLELGGSDPMVGLDGANLDAITSYALWGRFANAGQMCAAVKRLIVPAKHYEEILSLLKHKAGQLQVGPPEDPGSHMGPVISQAQLEQLQSQLQDALARSARLVFGGQPLERAGYFMPPTILADVPPEARVLTEEVFGPILPVVAYQTLEEAIELANNTPFGLTASVFGPPKTAHAVAEHLQAGCVMVNDVGPTNYALPSVHWNGWKHSGPGVSHGAHGLLDATLGQTVTENWLIKFPLFRKQPWHFDKTPSTQFSETMIETFASENWGDKLKPSLLIQMLKNRSSKKI